MAVESVGEQLKRLRLAAGRSQRDLAVPGVSYAYISRIEAGTRQPSVKALRRLAAGLGVSTEYLELGIERTKTDDLVEALVLRTGQGIGPISFSMEAAEPGAEMRVASVALAFGYELERRTVHAASLTDALIVALDWTRELERLRAERERLEEAERALREAEVVDAAA